MKNSNYILKTEDDSSLQSKYRTENYAIMFSTAFSAVEKGILFSTACVIVHILLQNIIWKTLSGRISKVVASHAAVSSSNPAEAALIYIMHEALRVYSP